MVYHCNTYQHMASESSTPTRSSIAISTTGHRAGATMYYLIHTPHHPRPYLSTVSFIANDFAKWGCLVTRHAKSSPYITEVRYQEKRHRSAHRRVELIEVWAQEVLARKSRPTLAAAREVTLPEERKERASAFVQDFVSSLSVLESPIVAPPALPNDPLPLPAYPSALAARYTRLLHRCAYIIYATLPQWTDPEINIADQVALEFRFEKNLKRAQLSYALNQAIGKRTGRMGKIERCDETGITKVFMWVDVGDLVAREMDCGKGEVDDPVPTYEVGGWAWPNYECEG